MSRRSVLQVSGIAIAASLLEALRMVAHLIYVTALQTRALLECFLDQGSFIRIHVAFCRRLLSPTSACGAWF